LKYLKIVAILYFKNKPYLGKERNFYGGVKNARLVDGLFNANY